MSHQFVYAIARTVSQALQIEDRLTQAGFSNREISALIPDNDSSPEFARLVHTHEPERTVSGAAIGGVLGGALGLLASIGALVIPGAGRLIAVGPLLAALNAVVNGAAAVGISGALAGLGIPAKAAVLFEHHIVKGNILVSVHVETADEVATAWDVLEQTMAEDIGVASISNPEATA